MGESSLADNISWDTDPTTKFRGLNVTHVRVGGDQQTFHRAKTSTVLCMARQAWQTFFSSYISESDFKKRFRIASCNFNCEEKVLIIELQEEP